MGYFYALAVGQFYSVANSWRRFFDLWANHKSVIAEQALARFARPNEIEAVKKVPNGSATARATDHSLLRWAAFAPASVLPRS